MGWFTSKDWQIIPMDELVSHYKRNPVYFDEVIESLDEFFPVTTIAVLKRGDAVMNYYYHPIKGCMYGSKGPNYAIPERNPDERIAKRLNAGWTIVTDNR